MYPQLAPDVDMQVTAAQPACTAGVQQAQLPPLYGKPYSHIPKGISSCASSSIGAAHSSDGHEHDDECPVRRAMRLASCSREQLEAHCVAEAAAVAAAAASKATSSGVPISRIASWISSLPEVSSCKSEGPEPAPALSTSSHSWHDVDYEKAACDPSLARPSIWYSEVDSEDREPIGCCAFLKFLAPPV